MSEPLERCGLCLFASPNGWVVGRNTFKCRRHAPHAAAGGEMRGFAAWPVVEDHEWCGDFQALPRDDKP